jgi:hypothetical protein
MAEDKNDEDEDGVLRLPAVAARGIRGPLHASPSAPQLRNPHNCSSSYPPHETSAITGNRDDYELKYSFVISYFHV